MKTLLQMFETSPSPKGGMAAVLIAVFLFVSPAFSKTLEEYRENVVHIKKDFASILGDDWKSAEEKSRFLEGVTDEIGRLLPPEDSVEISGKTIEINNKWLSDKVESLKNEPENSDKRALILAEIAERLEAIESQLRTLEESTSDFKTKDENKRKISEVLAREEFQKPTEDGLSFIEKTWVWIKEWFRSFFPKPEIKPGVPGAFSSAPYFLQIALYVLVIGVIGFLLYRFAPLILRRFRMGSKKESGDKIILGEKLSANETSETLFSEAERLAREGDLKAAIRKGYIALLFELSERKLLGLAKHKTNRDYLFDVRKRESLYQNMSGLTSNYERHWYGFEPVENADWEDFRNGYEDAIETMR